LITPTRNFRILIWCGQDEIFLLISPLVSRKLIVFAESQKNGLSEEKVKRRFQFKNTLQDKELNEDDRSF